LNLTRTGHPQPSEGALRGIASDSSKECRMQSKFEQQGFVGPVRVLSSADCRRFIRSATSEHQPPPLDWTKGQAATSRPFYEICTHPQILDVVSNLLGGDVLLWGATLIERAPGAVHPWHTDMETAHPKCRGVSVWIGLDRTAAESSLQVLPGSHRFGPTLQEIRRAEGLQRHESTSDIVENWARRYAPDAAVFKPTMSDGDAIFFDGRLWHHTDNRTSQTRCALLLQYAATDQPIHMPDFSHLDWPFRSFPAPAPPCVLLRGSADVGVNRIVRAPVAPSGGKGVQLSTSVCPLRLPFELPAVGEIWRPFPQFGGSTAEIDSMACHVSTLMPGATPHPPHRHPEEEVLLLLRGEVELTLPDIATEDGSEHRRRLQPGEFVYYPPEFAHTLTNVGDEPANYLMYKWQSAPYACATPMSFGQFSVHDEVGATSDNGFATRLLFEGPSAYLRKFHCHLSRLEPGAGYAAHYDAYEKSIILLEGEVQTGGVTLQAPAVAFFAVGEALGLQNTGSLPARYVVFEFHGSQQSLRPALPADAHDELSSQPEPEPITASAPELAPAPELVAPAPIEQPTSVEALEPEPVQANLVPLEPAVPDLPAAAVVTVEPSARIPATPFIVKVTDPRRWIRRFRAVVNAARGR